MKTFYLLLLALTFTAVSCKTKDGEPGPAGESTLIKQGSISGTITYTDANGIDVAVPFDYQYYESLVYNYFTYEEEGSGSYYEVDLLRRDLADANNYFYFNIEGTGLNGVEANPEYTSIDFSLLKVINNELNTFYDSEIEITNLSLDPTTGRLIFDFSGTVYDDYDNNGDITGRVDVIVNRLNEN